MEICLKSDPHCIIRLNLLFVDVRDAYMTELHIVGPGQPARTGQWVLLSFCPHMRLGKGNTSIANLVSFIVM